METGNFENGKARKKELENKCLISCGICPYHKGENKTWHRPRPDKYKNKRKVPIKKITVDSWLVADFNEVIEKEKEKENERSIRSSR